MHAETPTQQRCPFLVVARTCCIDDRQRILEMGTNALVVILHHSWNCVTNEKTVRFFVVLRLIFAFFTPFSLIFFTGYICFLYTQAARAERRALLHTCIMQRMRYTPCCIACAPFCIACAAVCRRRSSSFHSFIMQC